MGSSVPRFGATGRKVTRVAVRGNNDGTMRRRRYKGISTNGIDRLT